MSKPLGMTAWLQIVRPTPTEDKIYDAVEAAIEHGIPVEEFFREARDCWRIALDEKRTSDQRALDRMQP